MEAGADADAERLQYLPRDPDLQNIADQQLVKRNRVSFSLILACTVVIIGMSVVESPGIAVFFARMGYYLLPMLCLLITIVFAPKGPPRASLPYVAATMFAGSLGSLRLAGMRYAEYSHTSAFELSLRVGAALVFHLSMLTAALGCHLKPDDIIQHFWPLLRVLYVLCNVVRLGACFALRWAVTPQPTSYPPGPEVPFEAAVAYNLLQIVITAAATAERRERLCAYSGGTLITLTLHDIGPCGGAPSGCTTCGGVPSSGAAVGGGEVAAAVAAFSNYFFGFGASLQDVGSMLHDNSDAMAIQHRINNLEVKMVALAAESDRAHRELQEWQVVAAGLDMPGTMQPARAGGGARAGGRRRGRHPPRAATSEDPHTSAAVLPASVEDATDEVERLMVPQPPNRPGKQLS